MKFSNILFVLWSFSIIHCNAMEIQPLSRDEKGQKAEHIITEHLISESLYREQSKQQFENLWQSLSDTTKNRYDLIEKSIVELLQYIDEISDKISGQDYDNFMKGTYWLLNLFCYDLKKNNIFDYFDCIRDPFIEREKARLSEACEDELERRMEEIKTLDQWKPGESIIFEVELRKKGELPE